MDVSLIGASCLCLLAVFCVSAGSSAREPESARSGRFPEPVVSAAATEFPLSAVRLLDGPFRKAQETDRAFLLRIDPDRLLAGFRREAGLPGKAEPYGGWETIPEEGRYSLAGQGLGHYLSALCMMAASTGDAECARRARYIVSELAACQKAAGKTGILCAFPQSKALFGELAAGEIRSDHLFGLNGGYVPLYVTHKVMACLRDAWLILGNRTARDVLVRMAGWLDGVFAGLTDEQIREMLETEHGGIMEVVADVYAITGETRFLNLAKRLNHQSLFQPLVKGEDTLTGLHANAQIPKAIGMERVYRLTGQKDYGKASRFFWDRVANYRSFSIGGHGDNEFFFSPEAFATTGIESKTGPETCNTYNMLKLSRQLWLVEPRAATADFIERALYNHILPTQEPEKGGFTYFTSMRPGHYRTYSSDTDDFWCCVDTGMESHAKHASFIYAHSGDRLWVDLLIASELNWSEQGAKVRLETRFPEDSTATLTFSLRKPKWLAINIRRPGWLKPGAMRLSVNGEPQPVAARPDGYAAVERTWKTGDRLEVEWPPALRAETLPGSDEWVSLLWGPVVLAGELGREGIENVDLRATHNYVAEVELPVERVPVFAGTVNDVLGRVKPVAGKPLTFRTEGIGRPGDVTLSPFYRVHNQRYAVYWRLVKP
jgi:DUF1680 family protein